MNYIITILESFLGDCKRYNEETNQAQFDCPACSYEKGMHQGDGKGNLELNFKKDVFKCWVCKDTNNMHGSITKLIRRYGTDKHLRDYDLFKPEIIHTDYESYEDRVAKVITLPEGFKLLKDSTPRDFKYNLAINYLHSRGITSDIIKKYDIGYTTKGRYFNRIIIPSYNENKQLNYFIARWFDRQPNKIKYLNPEAEKELIIFNEYRINWDATIYLVEGVTDHIVVPNSIPLLGKFIPELLFNKLYEKAKGYIVILLDADAVEDAIKLYNKLDFGDLAGTIRICIPPDDFDPSQMHQAHGKLGIISMLKKSKILQ